MLASLIGFGLRLLFLIQCSPAGPTAGRTAKSSAPVDMGQYYGFKPVEVYKLEPRSSNLLTGDFNNDGLTDLALFDNSHARIDLLLQRRRPEETTTDAGLSSVNDVKGDWRFEHKTIALDKQLASMAIGDFNGDGRTDIACLGVPDRLIIYFQPASGEWNEHTMVRVPDVAPAQWNMAAGDLNGDGKDDLVILGRQQTYVFLQQPKGGPDDADHPDEHVRKAALAQVADLDGDGRKDLCYVAGEGQDRTLCARLQDGAGRLGPELQFEVDRPRSVSYAQLTGSPAREVLTIDAQTGRLRILQLQRPAKHNDEPAGRLVQTGFGRQDSGDSGRDFALGDVDGDGLTDLVVTDPDGAGVILFRQRKGEGLDPGQTFPSFAGDVQVRIAPLGKGGRARGRRSEHEREIDRHQPLSKRTAHFPRGAADSRRRAAAAGSGRSQRRQAAGDRLCLATSASRDPANTSSTHWSERKRGNGGPTRSAREDLADRARQFHDADRARAV